MALMPDVFAIEMEGAGAATVVRRLQSEGRAIGFFMIRGISDAPRTPSATGADEARGTQERDAWKIYAASAAASLFESLLRRPGAPPGLAREGDRSVAPRQGSSHRPDGAAAEASDVLRRQASLSTTDLAIEALRIARSVNHTAREWLAEELADHPYNGRYDNLPPYRTINIHVSKDPKQMLIQTWGNLERALVVAAGYFRNDQSIYPDSLREAERVMSPAPQKFLSYIDNGDDEIS